jgi:formyltetrahydrofolate hydrolase
MFVVHADIVVVRLGLCKRRLAGHDFTQPMRTVLLVSKEGHCLNDLLFRWKSGLLPLDIRAINIHHSFPPSFKGANPYYQAHDRGVKLIGATAHYVTADLDEGPIIEQDVARVDHSKTVEDLTALGRDTESQVLARAVKWHSEHRVLINGHKTVIFK